MRTHCATYAGWRKKLGLTWSSVARRPMDYDSGTGPHGRSWTISGGGDIPWKGKEERCLFGIGWKISLSPWIGSWVEWDSVSGDSGMLWIFVWECA